MRRLAVAVLAAGTALAFAPGAFAAPEPSGAVCELVAAPDPQVEGSQTGEVDGGPIALGDDTDPTVSYTGRLTCTVQVNAGSHAGPDACRVTGAYTPAVAAASGTCTYPANPGDNIYLCTQVEILGGPTLYYGSSNDPLVDGGWTTDPHAACKIQIGFDWSPVFPPAGFVTTTVSWNMAPGQSQPSFTPPNPTTSHPRNWTCATSFPSSRKARAECAPSPGQQDPGTTGWACYDPFVVADISVPVGTATVGVTGTSQCGTSVASCTAQTTLGSPVAQCQQWAFPHQPVPLVCEADYAAATAAATWTVRCAPVDP